MVYLIKIDRATTTYLYYKVGNKITIFPLIDKTLDKLNELSQSELNLYKAELETHDFIGK